MTEWDRQLDVARNAAMAAGRAVRPQFGLRTIAAYKGHNDVQLSADLAAEKIIVERLHDAFPDHGIVAEEGSRDGWPDTEYVWVVDPLDGSNNFGYGIAHCAVAITLFHAGDVVLAMVFDPLLEREFCATESRKLVPLTAPGSVLRQATVSLVSNYSTAARDWLGLANEVLAPRCKRAVNLWAPALDLALVASGAMDALVCHRGDLLDACGGMFLIKSSGGCVLDFEGRPFAANGVEFGEPVSFVAAGDAGLAEDLLDLLTSSVPRLVGEAT